MLGTLIGRRYKIIKLLGSGGFGRTYLSQDTQSETPLYCVIKHFQPVTTDERTLSIARRLFETEARILESLGRHDQIPGLLDFFEENQEFYIVEDFVEGCPLNDEFSKDNRLTEPEVIEFLRDVLQILDFVHSNRVIHRDIKPGNLIRRPDGKIVLIDFGAVKELGTQLTGGSGHTQFTVGICTQGYTPGEQLAGAPRFSSDIYALGVTAIQALTGRQPSEIPVDPDTSHLLWQDLVSVSPGFALILDRMVRYEFRTRFQSAADVLQALDNLANLPTNITEVPPSMVLPESLLRVPLRESLNHGKGWKGLLKSGLGTAIATSLAIAAGVIGIRQLGWLQPLELEVYDQLVRLTPALPTDSRLLIVEVTEADLQSLQRPTPSDETLAQLLSALQTYKPRIIGLDLHRDLPQDPGREALIEQLAAENMIAIMKLGDASSEPIPPPPTVPPERIGFNDFPVDPDGIVRRNLMFASQDGQVFHSFATRIAFSYLEQEGILPMNPSEDPSHMQLGNGHFLPLASNSGGYQTIDSAGYQVMLHYHSLNQLAPQVSLSEVLAGTVDPSLIEDKIILIGTTAPSAKDLFDTPFTASQRTEHQMAGVVLHGQMVSQILTAAEEGQGLFWFWPEWAEMGWIVLWALMGGAIAWYVHHPVSLGVSSVSVVVIGAGVSIFIFFNQGWVPVVAPLAAFALADGAIATYRFYRLQRYQNSIETMLWAE